MGRNPRHERTIEKARQGRLPAASEHTELTRPGDGRPCDGCGETIHPSETASIVTLAGGYEWRFHSECYSAWVTLRG